MAIANQEYSVSVQAKEYDLRTLKERNHANETLVLRISLPFGHNDGILGLH